MDFLTLFDDCVRESKPNLAAYEKPETLDVGIGDERIGLDSLDIVLVLTILGEIYEIPEKVMDKGAPLDSLRKLKAFLEEKGERVPDTLEEARELME